MLRALPGRLCFRRLGRLPTSCHHIAVGSAPRIPPSFGSKSYHNASFSARPNNSLAAKIWYRKDGVPRSKRKGVLFSVFLVLCAGATYTAVKVLKVQNESRAALNFALKLVLSGIDFSSAGADLSTPRSALMLYRDLFCAAVDKDTANRTAKEFDDLFKELDSGKFSPDQVQLLHLVAKESCELMRGNVLLITMFPEDDVAKGAGHVRNVMLLGRHVIQKAAVGENVKEYTEYYQALSHQRQSIDEVE